MLRLPCPPGRTLAAVLEPPVFRALAGAWSLWLLPGSVLG
jgi:hypothetical protein